ncbi:MAG: NACHT domain-containing protein, partial [Gammaproteobacteria bacterium]|nr:NACHT domain-containing protein [Gammaproteobacteria bacterium]
MPSIKTKPEITNPEKKAALIAVSCSSHDSEAPPAYYRGESFKTVMEYSKRFKGPKGNLIMYADYLYRLTHFALNNELEKLRAELIQQWLQDKQDTWITEHITELENITNPNVPDNQIKWETWLEHPCIAAKLDEAGEYYIRKRQERQEGEWKDGLTLVAGIKMVGWKSFLEDPKYKEYRDTIRAKIQESKKKDGKVEPRFKKLFNDLFTHYAKKDCEKLKTRWTDFSVIFRNSLHDFYKEKIDRNTLVWVSDEDKWYFKHKDKIFALENLPPFIDDSQKYINPKDMNAKSDIKAYISTNIRDNQKRVEAYDFKISKSRPDSPTLAAIKQATIFLYRDTETYKYIVAKPDERKATAGTFSEQAITELMQSVEVYTIEELHKTFVEDLTIDKQQKLKQIVAKDAIPKEKKPKDLEGQEIENLIVYLQQKDIAQSISRSKIVALHRLYLEEDIAVAYGWKENPDYHYDHIVYPKEMPPPARCIFTPGDTCLQYLELQIGEQPAPAGPPVPQPDQAIQALKQQLQAQYTKKGIHEIKRIFGGSGAISIDKFYTTLTIAPEERQKKQEDMLSSADNPLRFYEGLHASETQIPLEELFDEEKKLGSQILIIGKAGAGKSTMCNYMVASPNLYKRRFDFKFLIPLRNLRAHHYSFLLRKNGKISIAEVINHECFADQVNIDEINKLLATNRALLVLDGYDEVAPFHGDIRHELRDIINYLVNCESPVIITSRPYYTYQLQIKSVLENIGFVDKDIIEYVKKFFHDTPEQGEELIRFLRGNLSVWGTAHIPINLELVCSIWQNDSAQFKAGDSHISMTDLYKKINDFLSLRHEKATQIEKQKRHQYLVTEYLEHLAFSCLSDEKSSLIISSNAIGRTLDRFEKKVRKKFGGNSGLFDYVLQFGILKTVDDGEHESFKDYYFLHLTFMEFYTAIYVARLYPAEFAAIAQQHIAEPKWQIVWWFVAGLIKNDPAKLGMLFEQIDSIANYDYKMLLHLRCLDEAELSEAIPQKEKLLPQVRDFCSTMSLNLLECGSGNDFSNVIYDINRKREVMRYLQMSNN